MAIKIDKKQVIVFILLILNIILVPGSEIEVNSSNEFNVWINKTVDDNTLPSLKIEYLDIEYNSINIQPKELIEAKPYSNNNYIIMRFNEVLSINDIKELENNNIEIIEYVGGNSYIIYMSSNKKRNLEINNNNNRKFSNIKNYEINKYIHNKYLISYYEIDKEWKITNSDLTLFKNKDKSIAYIQVFRNVDLRKEKDSIITSNISILGYVDRINTYIVLGDSTDILNLVNNNKVKKIEYDKEKTDLLEYSKGAINVDLVHNNPYYLSGVNVRILEYEKDGVPYNHTDFGNRVINPETFDTINDHATHVAGIIIGNGSVDSRFKGIAYKSKLYGYEMDDPLIGDKIEDFETDYDEGINTYNIQIGTNSWGENLEVYGCTDAGSYNMWSELIDSYVYSTYFSAYPIPMVFAAGNFQTLNCLGEGYLTITPEASAKNTISVGYTLTYNNEIAPLSSFGPTQYNRIKPDLVAPGRYDLSTGIFSTYTNNSYFDMGGTSMAAPHVTGTIALLIEQWNISGYYNTIGNPQPSLIKAILLDSAIDLNKNGSGQQIVDGPDYKNGFGLLDAKGATDRIINNTFTTGSIINKNETDFYIINITNTSSALKVTLVWDEPPGENLYNDLNLLLISPSGKIFYPWTLNASSPSDPAVRTRLDDVNNVEQVYVFANETEIGKWLIKINATKCTTNCPQFYSIATNMTIYTNLSELPPIQQSNQILNYYQFEDNVDDSIDYHYNGITPGNTTYNFIQGRFGKGLNFSGNGEYFQFNQTIKGATGMSYSFWYNETEDYNDNLAFITGPNNTGFKLFHFCSFGHNECSYVAGINPNISGTVFEYDVAIQDYTDFEGMHHYVYTIDCTIDKGELYLDGRLVGRNDLDNFCTNLTMSAKGNFGITDNGFYNLQGTVDEMSIWSKVLNEYEIAQLANNPINVTNYSSNVTIPNPLQANSSLIIHYKFDNDLEDSSSYNNDGNSPTDIEYVAYEYNEGIRFNGSTSNFRFDQNLTNAHGITFAFWYDKPSGDYAHETIVRGTSSSNGFFVIHYCGSPYAPLCVYTFGTVANGGTEYLWDVYPQTTYFNGSHHYVYTVNCDDDSAKMYVDGEIFASGSIYTSCTTLTDNVSNGYFGKHQNGVYYLNGKVDDFMVWDKALDATEVTRLFADGIED